MKCVCITEKVKKNIKIKKIEAKKGIKRGVGGHDTRTKVKTRKPEF